MGFQNLQQRENSEMGPNSIMDERELRAATVSPLATMGCVGLLGSVTCLGFQIAEWSRFDKAPSLPAYLWWGINLFDHVFVLASWSFAWLILWKTVLNRRGGNSLALGVPILMAVLAEGVQKYLPGHIPDMVGLLYSLGGVTLAWGLFRRCFCQIRQSQTQMNPHSNCTL